MKKLIAITTATLLIICFSTVSAHAADRKTMEGFMIGTGVAILGAALLHNANKGPRLKVLTPDQDQHRDRNHYAGYGYGHKRKHHKRYHHGPRGHWEIEKVWVEPVYETKWNPGHYNRRGEWVEARNEKFLVKDGYYQEEKVWVWH